jgi:hypothetical protein
MGQYRRPDTARAPFQTHEKTGDPSLFSYHKVSENNLIEKLY